MQPLRRSRDWTGLSATISAQFASAADRLYKRADGRAEDAKTEIRAMGQFARRSIGQRMRWMGAEQ